jgi:hypothetical protein
MTAAIVVRLLGRFSTVAVSTVLDYSHPRFLMWVPPAEVLRAAEYLRATGGLQCQ